MTAEEREKLASFGQQIEAMPNGFEKLALIFVWQQVAKKLREARETEPGKS